MISSSRNSHSEGFYYTATCPTRTVPSCQAAYPTLKSQPQTAGQEYTQKGKTIQHNIRQVLSSNYPKHELVTVENIK
jgi:hypothetical protein